MTDSRPRRISTLGSRLTSLVSVALVLILAGMAAVATVAGGQLSDSLRRNLGFIVKMESDSSDIDINNLKQRLLADPSVETITFTSAADILKQETEAIGDDIADLLEGNPYSPEFDVKVKAAYAHPDSIACLTDIYSSAPAVSEVLSESSILEDVDSTLQRSAAILGIAALVLLAICIILINNTVSLSVYSRRFMIHTMKLVGATAAYIRRPFVAAAAANGLIAGLAATAALFAIRYYISTVDPLIAGTITLGTLAVIGAFLTVAGIAICAITATLAANRYLRASYDDMFLK